MFDRKLLFASLARRAGTGRRLRLRRSERAHRWSLRRPVLGIEIRGSSLHLACVRAGWGRRWLVGGGVIPDFVHLHFEHLRGRLREFLAPAGKEEPLVVLGLPRREAIVRIVRLPQAAKKSLREALELQIEMYKPTEEEEYCWDAAVAPGDTHLSASLALVPRGTVERLASQFSAAGYPISRLTVGQFSLLHLLLSSPQRASAPRLVCLDFKGAEVELAILVERELVYSRAFTLTTRTLTPEQSVQSELGQAFATLRWNDREPLVFVLAGSVPESVRTILAELGKVRRLGEWCEFDDAASKELQEHWGAVAVALDGSSWASPYRLNLLPGELRPPRRRWQHAPMIALLAANAILLAALGLRAPVERYVLLRQYARELGRIQRPATELVRVEEKQKTLLKRLEVLGEFQERGRLPLDALSEITQRLPADAWLNIFTCRQGQVELQGVAKSASSLLPALQASPQFFDVKFNGALTRDPSGVERFRLQMRTKERP